LWIEALLLLLGFVLLIKGADVFVGSSVSIAHKLKIPPIIIGLTIVAMGTGAPEVVISVTAALRGGGSLAISNIIGSNSFNLMFIIGLCAVIKAIAIDIRVISKDFLLSIFGAVALLIFMLVFNQYIPRLASLFLLVAFIIYLTLLIRKAHNSKEEIEEDAPKEFRPLPVLALIAVVSCVFIVIGGQLVVDNATQIALAIGITERIIGLTIVAMGTSLPELVTSLVACKKGENEFALGNLIGSNIFNILFILGLSGLITPLEFDSALIIDASFLIAGSLLAFIFALSRKVISRREGFIMVTLYSGYIIAVTLFL